MAEVAESPVVGRGGLSAEQVQQLVDNARAYVRSLNYEPASDEELAKSRDMLDRAHHENAMEGLARPPWSEAYDAMLQEERLPRTLRKDVTDRLLAEYVAMVQ